MRLWLCPACSRKFAKRNQWHSCGSISIDAHFEDKPPEIRALFDNLSARLGKFGPFRMDAVRSSINLAARHHFGGVRVLADGLRIGFILSQPVDHPRILRIERISPTIYAHRVKITRKEDLDATVLGWLKEAHARAS